MDSTNEQFFFNFITHNCQIKEKWDFDQQHACFLKCVCNQRPCHDREATLLYLLDLSNGLTMEWERETQVRGII